MKILRANYTIEILRTILKNFTKVKFGKHFKLEGSVVYFRVDSFTPLIFFEICICTSNM